MSCESFLLQAQTFKEDFIKERSERERKESDYLKLQQTSSETIEHIEKWLGSCPIQLKERKEAPEVESQHGSNLQNEEHTSEVFIAVLYNNCY